MAVFIQKLWRGYKARKQWARLKAAIRIQLKWKNYKSKKYHRELFAKFKDVKTMPNYGKGVSFPPHPSVLARFAELIRKIHLNWRALMMISALSKDQQKLMRRKIFTSSIFKGKKAWPINGAIYGNRLTSDTVGGPKFSAASQRTLNTVGDGSFVFSAYVLKVSTKGKGMPRAIGLSQKVLFEFALSFFLKSNLPLLLDNSISSGLIPRLSSPRSQASRWPTSAPFT